MTMTLEDFADVRPLGAGRIIVRCGCMAASCPGWAEVAAGEPWGLREHEALPDFVGPLMHGDEWYARQFEAVGAAFSQVARMINAMRDDGVIHADACVSNVGVHRDPDRITFKTARRVTVGGQSTLADEDFTTLSDQMAERYTSLLDRLRDS